MIKLNNGFKEYYYLDESNYRIYNAKSGKYLTIDSGGCYTLITESGKSKHISNNRILKMVLGSGFVLKDIDSLPDEEWKQINDSCYFISSKGRIKSNLLLESKILVPEYSSGYARVKIDIGYGSKNYLIHKLVAEFFLEPPTNPFMEIHHISFDKTENQASNLIFMKRDEHHKLHYDRRKTQSKENLTKPKE